MNLLDTLQHTQLQQQTRRHFFHDGLASLGALWLAMQGAHTTSAKAATAAGDAISPWTPRPPQLPARAKRVIFIHLAGAPSQFELFDHKPELNRLHGQDCPAEFLADQRFAFIRGVPQLMGSYYPFHQTGEAGFWISDRLPQLEQVLDKVCFIRTMQTDQFNHAPAQLLLQTGNAKLGYASLGSWVGYGLGTENQNLPGFVALLSGGRLPSAGKSIWGSGFLPSVYQGVQCRSAGDPVLFLKNPPEIDRSLRRQLVTAIHRINEQTYFDFGDAETLSRISQYELAFNMQMHASDAVDLTQEPEHMHHLYGTKLGTENFANNCLLARRLTERGVRFVQLFDWGWDSHGTNPQESIDRGFKNKCRSIDRPIAALLTDLEQRGLLEETLVIFASEFGRTPMRENRGGQTMPLVGRDHHPHAFTIWCAGGGVKRGFSFGETDPLGFAPVTRPVPVRDFHATIWHLLGLDPHQLTFLHRGLPQKITGVTPAQVINEIIA